VDRSQAETVVATVQAYFPRPELPESTVRAWANELEPFDFDDAQEAARRQGRDRSYPVLDELLDYVDEVRRERDVDDRPALPAAEFAEAMPPEVRARVDAMQDRWAADDLHRDPVVADAEWERVKTATLKRLQMHGVCLGVGKEPVELDGVLVCPACRVEIPRSAPTPRLQPSGHRRSWQTGETT